MRFAFTEEQIALRDGFRQALRRACPPDAVRAAWDASTDAHWSTLAELGALGALLPEALGGLGLGLLDAVLLFEVAGEVAVPSPLVDAAAVAGPLLVAGGADDLVRKLASGAVSVVATRTDRVAYGSEGAIAVRLTGGCASVMTVAGDWVREETVDRGRPMARLDWSRAEDLDVSPADVFTAADRGAVATAATLVGLGKHLIDMTVEYVKLRTQFGQPVGAYQAVQHQIVDALVELEFAKPLVYRAAHSLDQGDAEASIHASMAKVMAADAAYKASRAALQCHGAMGYSYEYDLHLWMKRVWALQRAWGDAPEHRARVADHLNLPKGV